MSVGTHCFRSQDALQKFDIKSLVQDGSINFDAAKQKLVDMAKPALKDELSKANKAIGAYRSAFKKAQKKKSGKTKETDVSANKPPHVQAILGIVEGASEDGANLLTVETAVRFTMDMLKDDSAVYLAEIGGIVAQIAGVKGLSGVSKWLFQQFAKHEDRLRLSHMRYCG